MAPQEKETSKFQRPLGRTVSLFINGEKYTLSATVSPHTRLVDFIRDVVNAKGTKVLCREGGCGACTVVATVPDLTNKDGTRTFSVQACQQLVFACSGWSVETIEYLGNRHKGYHKLQRSLAGFYGTQCGYCSPGMVMAAYGELKKTGTLTVEQVGRALDGNLCRCTGYRPIVDAFKAVADDAPAELKQHLVDIEEAYQKYCPTSGAPCKKTCGGACDVKGLTTKPVIEVLVDTGTVKWYQPIDLKRTYAIMAQPNDGGRTLLVCGNTGAGVYKNDGPYTRYISLTSVPELQGITATRDKVEIYSGVSLARCIDLFLKVSAPGPDYLPGYQYLQEVAKHWQLVANSGVRNNGTWAGNLALKRRHPEFPSDIFVTLAACDAELTVGVAKTEAVERFPVADLLKHDLEGKLLLSVVLPKLDDSTYVRTYKITPRAVNAHAYVNAAFRLPVDPHDDFKVKGTCSIVFGGISDTFVSATETQQFLQGKSLKDISVVQQAIAKLAVEVVPKADKKQGSEAYRKGLVASLFYKTVVWLLKDEVPPALRTAGEKVVRAVGKGQQEFDPNRDSWPIGEAIPKIESNIQVSGEAEYGADILPAHGELQGVFVLTNVANAKIDNIDASDALAVPGVVTFVSAEDIESENTFVQTRSSFADKIFAAGRTDYAGQPIGLIVAKTREIGLEAAKLVRVQYSDRKKPILTIQDAIKHVERVLVPLDFETGKTSPFRLQEGAEIGIISSSKHRIAGDIDIGTQFHFAMEALHATIVPTEDGYDVTATTQHVTETQSVVANVLGVPANSINMSLRRIGGGFGGKITRGNLVACATAVAVRKIQKPVRVTLDLQTNMKVVGWREPYYASYEAGFNDEGVLDALKVDLYGDPGYVNNDSAVTMAAHMIPNVYASQSYDINAKSVKTDTAANTYCRTPGLTEGIAVIENIMDHIAVELGKDPLLVREANFKPDVKGGEANELKNKIMPVLKEKASLEMRKQQVLDFNNANRWVKRGLAVCPLRYPFSYPPPFRYATQVIIYAHDGTVAITHGGVEMGQGINTKAAQVAAGILGVPLSLVKVKPNTTVGSANSFVTGGSFGSDVVCHGIKVCCERLRHRIDAVKKSLPKPQEWDALVRTCLAMDMDLSERYWTAAREHPDGYVIWAAAALEVEVDALTGMFKVRKVELDALTGMFKVREVELDPLTGMFKVREVELDPLTGMFKVREVELDPLTGMFKVREVELDALTGMFKVRKVELDALTGMFEVREVVLDALTGMFEVREVELDALTGMFKVRKVELDALTGMFKVRKVELDALNGMFKILRADIVEDAGQSLSPYVDVGQVEGAFIMGLGLYSTEELKFNEDTGEKDVTGTWEYKLPTALDIPEDLRVYFLSNASNPYGVLRSKATGEPPLCVSYVIVSALRQAISAVRSDAGVNGWFPMHTPLTVEKIQQLCLVKPEQFKLQ
ncbi:Aldehyde oxidase/xanthine dehydrogenase molybdopterin binding [Trinorchestia longiramus]|nr:Aldehyde oxidase/xanthine dehydrogenase molybdopterin binding [Trinorchestia longiramus]